MIACQILMPLNDALKAEVLLAWGTLDLSNFLVLGFDDYIFTFWVRAELFKVTAHHFFICLELYKLFVSGLIADLSHKILRNWLCTSLLRAFYKETLVTRLSDFKCKEITIALFAKSVATPSISNEIRFVVLYIADFTKLGTQIFSLWVNNQVLLKVLRIKKGEIYIFHFRVVRYINNL